MQGIQYVDGLGRPIQTIQVMGSPFGNDLVQPQAYDIYGREIYKYLPYVSTTGTVGSFRTSATTAQQTFYNAPPGGVSPIWPANAQTVFDNSPLSRPVEQGAPGTDWQVGQHTVKIDYASNNNTAWGTDSANSRQVALYTTTISTGGSQTLARTGNTATYGAGQLTITISKDENWAGGRAGTVEEYKDIDGKVILKRTYNYDSTGLQQLSTYYVYDDFGRLAFVLPPGANPDATSAISGTTLNNFCYQYAYDGLGRMMQKRLPGKGWEYTVYNNMDQPVATQDSLQKNANQWIFTKYDAQGRVASTGIWTNGGTAITRASLQTTLNGISTNLYESQLTTGTGYTNAAWPTGNTTALTYNYYDNYNNAPSMPPGFTAPTGADLGTRGQLVATKTAVLNTPANMLWAAHYYDYLGRSLTAYSQHYLGGTLNANNYDAVSATYDFTNAPTTTTRKHWTSASTANPLVTVTNTYLYDHAGRKLKTWEQIQNGVSTPTTKTLLSKIDYNEIGQVMTKNLHATTDSTTFLQPVAYTYNERGWLRTSNADLFQMELQYNTGSHKEYNGNIAYQLWGTRVAPGTNNFAYSYDKLNRLISGASSGNYKERGITYDPMGNIKTLNRYQAGTIIDSLLYTYTGNQPGTIADRSTDASTNGMVALTTTYVHDGNGNVSSNTNATNTRLNKSYTYNLLNLPQVITIPTGTVTYTYDATGRKLRKVVTGTGAGTTEYIDGIQYLNSTTAIDFIATEEGRADVNGTSYDYQYYLADNLGNTRRTFATKTGSAVLLQTDDYYPFGLEINTFVSSPKNEYLYNKKELQEELGQYDYGARFYDPVIARWTTVDAHAETDRRWTPYNYASCDPISRLDPDGNKDQPFNKDHDKPITYRKGTATPVNIGVFDHWLNPDNNKNCYNCHSFAFHNSQGDPANNPKAVKDGQPKWDDHPEKDVNKKGVHQLGSKENNKAGDRVIYYVDSNKDGKYENGEEIIHSAIVTKVDKSGNTIEVAAKLGQEGIADNHPDAPGYYNEDIKGQQTSRAYFRIDPPKKKTEDGKKE
ncbi:MAG: DUF6443 domain-containing protein [Bacteroidota bacterium]